MFSLSYCPSVGHTPYVFYHIFDDLDYRQSGSNNDDNPLDLFVVPIYKDQHVDDEFGLFDDDDDEDNLTLFGKMIIMIKLEEKDCISNRIAIILFYA
jgi:hypothetical protein